MQHELSFRKNFRKKKANVFYSILTYFWRILFPDKKTLDTAYFKKYFTYFSTLTQPLTSSAVTAELLMNSGKIIISRVKDVICQIKLFIIGLLIVDWNYSSGWIFRCLYSSSLKKTTKISSFHPNLIITSSGSIVSGQNAFLETLN